MKTALLFGFLGLATADLRMGAQARNGFKLRQQNNGEGRNAQFIAATTTNVGIIEGGEIVNPDVAGKTVTGDRNGRVPYMEPSAFSYQGLENQRANNYDNFLRSNIDNEQDNRNFNNEAGEDHLPFRTLKANADLEYPHGKIGQPGTSSDQQALQRVADGNQDIVSTTIVVTPGEEKLIPLRWNNPHAAEIEVNVWLMHAVPPMIVPVKRPTCSGEGNQDNVMTFQIPMDFNHVDFAAVPGLEKQLGMAAAGGTPTKKLCQEDGDCVLQIYAHSVETRQYTTSVPIKIIGNPCDVDPTPCLGEHDAFNNAPAQAHDAGEAARYAWPRSFDLKTYLGAGDANQGRGARRLEAVPEAKLEICASPHRGGKTNQGDETILTDETQIIDTHGAGYIYICNHGDIDLVDTVEFEVVGAGAGTKTEHVGLFEYTPITTNGLSTITAKVYGYGKSPVARTLTAKVSWTGAGGSMRHRRLREVEEARRRLTTTPKAQRRLGEANPTISDPGYDLSKLKRETCLSAMDEAANYKHASLQAAKLHSDVNNHAYQNSNYSPYSGQQHGEISRNLQAAAVVHMTASNFGELGKNAIDGNVRNLANQLNNQVNNLYQAYEKVANQIIDDITNNGAQQTRAKAADVWDGNKGRNTGFLANSNGDVQKLAVSFRAQEKGATSQTRQKTTTYVPSFKVNAAALGGAQKIAARAGPRRDRDKYADLIAEKATGDSYVEIYQATMNKMLPAFAKAADAGVSYFPSAVKECTGSMSDQGPGQCGATMSDPTAFKKRNAQGRQDGGRYAGTLAFKARATRLYDCPQQCYPATRDEANKCTDLRNKIIRDSRGTCVGRNAAGVDCSACLGLYTNIYDSEKGAATVIRAAATKEYVDPKTVEKQVEEGGENDAPTDVLPDPSADCWTDSFVCYKKGAEGYETQDERCGNVQPQAGEEIVEFPSTERANMCKDMCGDAGMDEDCTEASAPKPLSTGVVVGAGAAVVAVVAVVAVIAGVIVSRSRGSEEYETLKTPQRRSTAERDQEQGITTAQTTNGPDAARTILV